MSLTSWPSVFDEAAPCEQCGFVVKTPFLVLKFITEKAVGRTAVFVLFDAERYRLSSALSSKSSQRDCTRKAVELANDVA